MPTELEKLKMSDGTTTVAQFIRSRPPASAPYLISAASECLRRNLALNQAELQIAARTIRYAL